MLSGTFLGIVDHNSFTKKEVVLVTMVYEYICLTHSLLQKPRTFHVSP